MSICSRFQPTSSRNLRLYFADTTIISSVTSSSGPLGQNTDTLVMDRAMPTTHLDYYSALLTPSPDCPTGLLSRTQDLSSLVGPWTTGSLPGTKLVTIDIYKEMHATTLSIPMNRYRYFKAHSRFELRCQANNFFYGSLKMVWTPFPLPTTFDLSGIPGGALNQVSNLPGVRAEANGDGVALDVPFFNEFPSIDQRVNSAGSLGFITIVVYSRLCCIDSASSSAPVSISLLANFVDPVVNGPLAV